MNFIYPQNRPDLYFQLLTESQYNEQLAILTNQPEESYLGFDEEKGFIRFSSVGKIYETIKGLFGFGNQTDQTRIEAELLKFLYYGEARGFLTEERLTSLRGRFYYTNLPVLPSALKLFRKIQKQHRTPNPERPARMRGVVINYHLQNQSWLAPHFWSRFGRTPGVQEPLVHFGDTSLQLAEKALNLPQRDVQGAFKQLLHAFHLKNTHPDFQRKLALQFKGFIAACRNEEVLAGQSEQIQKIWIELARTSYRNQRPEEAREYLDEVLAGQPAQEVKNQIGETYLTYQDFDKMGPFLPALQQACSNSSLLIQIGKAYCHYQRYPEAVSAKQKAIRLLSATEPNKAAALHMEIGQAYFQRLAGLDSQDSLTNAIHHFQEAHQLENTPQSASCLLSAYLRQWQEIPASFPRLFGPEWLKLISRCPTNLPEENQAAFIEIILACAEEAYRTNQKQQAQAYLQRGMTFYQNKDSFVLKALEQSLNFNDCAWLQSKLNTLETKYAGHPRIQKKLGEIQWAGDKNHAIFLFNHAMHLFEIEINTSLQEDVKRECALHLAELHAKIGENHLHSPQGIFRTIAYPEAIDNLEKAAQLNPQAYGELLFDAYLKAALDEKSKTFITRDWKKAMLYQSKAFKIAPQNGPYLVELMDHYLAEDHSEALRLFNSIQALPWSEAAAFTAKQLDKLAHLLFNSGELTLSQKCREKALQLDPANGEYKRKLYQLILSQCKMKQAKATAAETNEEKMTLLLEAAATLEDQVQKGFSKIEDLKGEYSSALTEGYWLLANTCKDQFLITNGYTKAELNAHRSQHDLQIKKAIAFYEKGLAIQPENPILYFEKGMVLEFVFRMDEALEDFRLAVKYDKENSFYRQKLAFAYGTLAKFDKTKQHEERLKEILAIPVAEFYKAYTLWNEEYFEKNKTQSTDPHK
jgi:tetratricopeptide (TPR) repeat protein